MPVLVAEPVTKPDATTAALAVDVRKQLAMFTVSKTRKALYTKWLKAHPNY